MRHLLALAAVKPPELIDQPYWTANEFVNKPWLGAKLMCFGDVNPVTWLGVSRVKFNTCLYIK